MDANQLLALVKLHAEAMSKNVAHDLGAQLGTAGAAAGAAASTIASNIRVTADVSVKFTLEVPLLPDPSVTLKGRFSVRPSPAGPVIEASDMAIVPSL